MTYVLHEPPTKEQLDEWDRILGREGYEQDQATIGMWEARVLLAEAREAARLREAQPYASKEWDLTHAEIDRLRAEVARLREVDPVTEALRESELIRSRHCAEIDRLRAEVARLRRLEPPLDPPR
jgi:hypothetical protein